MMHAQAPKEDAVIAAPQSLEQVKPGDILIGEHYSWSPKSLVYVDRVTKTQITDTNGNRWSKRTGRRIGDAKYNAGHNYVRIPKPGEVKAVKAEMDRLRLAKRISWRLGVVGRVLQLSDAEMGQIWGILIAHDTRENAAAAAR